MAFRLPRLPTTYTPQQFQKWWQQLCERMEAQEDTQDTLLSQIQASLALAGVGVVATDAAGATAVSGQTTTTGLSVVDENWVAGPTVSLAGVGGPMTALTLTGSGPQSAVSEGGPMDGEYRIVEVGPAVTIFTGRFTVRTTVTGTTLVSLLDPVNTEVFTRATVGAVDYRMDLRRTAGAGTATALQAYLFARRAPP